jgi:hypothetical protein
LLLPPSDFAGIRKTLTETLQFALGAQPEFLIATARPAMLLPRSCARARMRLSGTLAPAPGKRHKVLVIRLGGPALRGSVGDRGRQAPCLRDFTLDLVAVYVFRHGFPLRIEREDGKMVRHLQGCAGHVDR